MEILRFLPLCLLFSFLLPGTAYARVNSTGDLFYDEGMVVYNRPWVPSDQYVRQDVFPWAMPLLNTNKDMFDHVQKPGDPNIEGHFSAHVKSIPDEPLYHWPKDTPYP